MKRRALLVVALVALAGCGGHGSVPALEPPQPDATTPPGNSTEPATEQAQQVAVTELESTLGDVNATAVWRRVGTVVGVDLPSSPPDVVVLTREPGVRYTPSQFRQSMGVEGYTTSSPLPSGRYRPSGTVVIKRTPDSTDRQVESLLAHEFAHALQYERLVTEFPDGDALPEQTVVEGSAEYVEWRYAARYGSHDSEQWYKRVVPEWPSVGKLFQAHYYLGAQWVRNHSDPEAPLESTFENPPTTAEQVLHDLPPGSEAPRNLTVHGESGPTAQFDHASPERRGEAELRFLLEYGLSSARAERAAAGWGEDRWMRFANASADGYAWVVRWDDPSEATEFRTLFADYRANVSEPLALRSVGDDTTVVLSGREAFVENATVSGTEGNVTVTAGN